MAEDEEFIVVKADKEKSDDETIAEMEESLQDWIACRKDTIKTLREIAAHIESVRITFKTNMKRILPFSPFLVFLLMHLSSLFYEIVLSFCKT